MRTLFIALLFAGLLGSSLSAADYKEPLTGIKFPDNVAGFNRGKVTPYQAGPGQGGVAVPYSSQDAEATVYLRGSGDDTHRTSNDYLKESLAGIKVLQSQGKYSNVQFFESDPQKERPGWSSGAFTSGATNRLLVSLIYCKVVSGHLIKIRASTTNRRNERLQPFVQSIQDLVDHAMGPERSRSPARKKGP